MRSNPINNRCYRKMKKIKPHLRVQLQTKKWKRISMCSAKKVKKKSRMDKKMANKWISTMKKMMKIRWVITSTRILNLMKQMNIGIRSSYCSSRFNQIRMILSTLLRSACILGMIHRLRLMPITSMLYLLKDIKHLWISRLLNKTFRTNSKISISANNCYSSQIRTTRWIATNNNQFNRRLTLSIRITIHKYILTI